MNPRYAIVFFIALVGCVPFEFPTSPNLLPIWDSYENPTFNFTPQSANRIIERFATASERNGKVDYLRSATSAVVQFDENAETTDDGTEINGLPIASDAVVDVSLRCENDRRIELTALVKSSRIQPTIWGETEGCLSEVDSTAVVFSSDIAVYAPGLGDELGPILVTYDLSSITIDGVSEPVWESSFRRLTDDSIETLIEIAGEYVVVSKRDEQIAIRAQNGIWQCETGEQRCSELP